MDQAVSTFQKFKTASCIVQSPLVPFEAFVLSETFVWVYFGRRGSNFRGFVQKVFQNKLSNIPPSAGQRDSHVC